MNKTNQGEGMDDKLSIPTTRRGKGGRYHRRGAVEQTAPTRASVLRQETLGYNMTNERKKLGMDKGDD